MADKSNQLILEGLSRGLAEPDGLPLHGGRSAACLFPGTAGGKQAARRCLDESLLQVVQSGTRGKAGADICAVTDKGLNHFMAQVGPRQVLEDLVRALEARQGQVGELLAATERTHRTLEGLKTTAEKVLAELVREARQASAKQPDPTWAGDILDHLAGWHRARPSEDCPLPDLYRQVRIKSPFLSIGHFHDALRLLHEREQVYLHPWTGPLSRMPEPPYSLLIGHEIAYYASRRSA